MILKFIKCMTSMYIYTCICYKHTVSLATRKRGKEEREGREGGREGGRERERERDKRRSSFNGLLWRG